MQTIAMAAQSCRCKVDPIRGRDAAGDGGGAQLKWKPSARPARRPASRPRLSAAPAAPAAPAASAGGSGRRRRRKLMQLKQLGRPSVRQLFNRRRPPLGPSGSARPVRRGRGALEAEGRARGSRLEARSSRLADPAPSERLAHVGRSAGLSRRSESGRQRPLNQPFKPKTRHVYVTRPARGASHWRPEVASAGPRAEQTRGPPPTQWAAHLAPPSDPLDLRPPAIGALPPPGCHMAGPTQLSPLEGPSWGRTRACASRPQLARVQSGRRRREIYGPRAPQTPSSRHFFASGRPVEATARMMEHQQVALESNEAPREGGGRINS